MELKIRKIEGINFIKNHLLKKSIRGYECSLGAFSFQLRAPRRAQ
jgi:hypothetical protein